jgi:hypothetical protein
MCSPGWRRQKPPHQHPKWGDGSCAISGLAGSRKEGHRAGYRRDVRCRAVGRRAGGGCHDPAAACRRWPPRSQPPDRGTAADDPAADGTRLPLAALPRLTAPGCRSAADGTRLPLAARALVVCSTAVGHLAAGRRAAGLRREDGCRAVGRRTGGVRRGVSRRMVSGRAAGRLAAGRRAAGTRVRVVGRLIACRIAGRLVAGL